MAPAVRVRPYKDFLTPALHRRFSRAAVVLLEVCYVEALFLGEWNSFIWSWFPFGRAGIRTGLLFICAFSIFVLRVAQLHVGIRTTKSGFQTFQQYAFKYQTIQTAGWYLFSAWLFGEIYQYSSSPSSNLNWIIAGNSSERAKLNERPIYLKSYLISLALVQTIFHLWYDYDRINIPAIKTKPEPNSIQPAPLAVSPTAYLTEQWFTILRVSPIRSLVLALAMPCIYEVFIRQTVWGYTLMFAKIFWKLPKSSALPTHIPYTLPMILRTFGAGLMVVTMWEFSNAAFSAYVGQEPLKNERPITYESRDPNGSLLTGLKGKKLHTRAFAFWELVYIAERFQGRRKALFEEIDRIGGSTWSQVLTLCLQTIKDIDSRSKAYFNPIPEVSAVIKVSKPEDAGLPRIVAPAKVDDIFTPPRLPQTTGAFIAQQVTTAAKKRGQSPSSTLVSKAEKILVQASTVLRHEQQNALAPAGILATFEGYIKQFLNTFFGRPFRQTFRSRMAAIVLGTPYGDVGIIVDAIETLTRLSVCSLKEDMYGNVQRDVPTIIKTFTTTATVLEDTRMKLGVHWTDVEGKQESPEADIILKALKGGLTELLKAFSEYAQDLGLSQTDLRLAREIANAPIHGGNNAAQQTPVSNAVGGANRTGETEISKPSKADAEKAQGSRRPYLQDTSNTPPRRRSEGNNGQSSSRRVEMQEVKDSGRS